MKRKGTDPKTGTDRTVQTVMKLSQPLLQPLHALVGDMHAMTSFELLHEQTACLTFVSSSEECG